MSDLTRDEIIARACATADEILQSERDAQHWNRAHPDEEPLTIGADLVAWAERVRASFPLSAAGRGAR